MAIRLIEYLKSLVRELIKLPNDTEWVEFKCNNKNPQMIGEYISCLSNSATLCESTNSAVESGYIKVMNPDTAPRYKKYIPYWA